MENLSIAHVVLSLPVGGTERLVEQMIQNPPPGATSACICLDEKGQIGEELSLRGFAVHALHRKPGVDWSLPRKIARLAKAEGYTILHCHQYTPWFYGVLSRLAYPSLKVLLTEHGRFHPDLSSRKRKFFNKIMAPFSHGISAVSPATRQALIGIEGFPSSRVGVVLNGIQVREPVMDQREARHQLDLPLDGVYFILCARFDPIKWIPGLVEAFAQVVLRFPNARLLLIGDGPDKAAILETISRLRLNDKVVLPGFREDVGTWLRAADVFCLASHSEGTSVSLIEAMSLGLPAVVTDVGGNPFVVEKNQTALLVPPADANALGVAMTTLAQDPQLRVRMGTASKERFQKHFRMDIMLKNYARIYSDIAAGRKFP
jgi:glycosyltransferase involved in cell wall biosynthesis